MKHDIYLRAMLKDKNIRTFDLAKKLGISQATLNRKIQGKVKFSDKNIENLTEILDMTYEEIFKPDKVAVKSKFEWGDKMKNGHLEIILQTKNGKIKYVFKNPDLITEFEKIIYDEMIKLEGSRKLRLQDVAKIKG